MTEYDNRFLSSRTIYVYRVSCSCDSQRCFYLGSNLGAARTIVSVSHSVDSGHTPKICYSKLDWKSMASEYLAEKILEERRIP